MSTSVELPWFASVTRSESVFTCYTTTDFSEVGELPPFAGGPDVATFIETVEKMGQKYRWTEEQRFEVMCSKLAGRAREDFFDFPNSWRPSTLTSLCNWLTYWFGEHIALPTIAVAEEAVKSSEQHESVNDEVNLTRIIVDTAKAEAYAERAQHELEVCADLPQAPSENTITEETSSTNTTKRHQRLHLHRNRQNHRIRRRQRPRLRRRQRHRLRRRQRLRLRRRPRQRVRRRQRHRLRRRQRRRQRDHRSRYHRKYRRRYRSEHSRFRIRYERRRYRSESRCSRHRSYRRRRDYRLCRYRSETRRRRRRHCCVQEIWRTRKKQKCSVFVLVSYQCSEKKIVILFCLLLLLQKARTFNDRFYFLYIMVSNIYI